MCDYDCKVLKKYVYEIISMMYSHNCYPLEERENKIIQYFEDNFIPGHRPECVKQMINIIIAKDMEIGIYFPTTLIEHAIDKSMFKFLSVLLEYSEGKFNNTGDKFTLGYRVLNKAYIWTKYYPYLRQFLEGGPKTYNEHLFLKQIFRELNCFDLNILVTLCNQIIDIIKLLLEYGTKLDYYHDENVRYNFSLLIKFIDISAYYPDVNTSEICDVLLSNYIFLMEGPGINYIDPETKKSLNVLEYAQSRKDNEHRKIICEKIIDYFIHQPIVNEINKIIPFPIAEEIIPHIIDHKFF